MTARLQAQPRELLNEDFTAEDMHPADIEQLLEAALIEYDEMPKHTHKRKQYRDAYNAIVDIHTEKRGFKQFNYLTP